MRIEEDRIVEISYELREGNADGELLERMDVNYPFKFYFGSGKMLPAFEARLHGLEEGDAFAFHLAPEEAYGPRRPGNILRIARDAFRHAPNTVVEGNYISLTDDQGEAHPGKILSFDEQTVEVDFNHAMAGLTLYFRGSVLHVRPATVDELIRKHYIEADGLRRPDFGEGPANDLLS